MTAEAVKAKLRKRYPATQMMGSASIPGPWVCVEEWNRIDMLAIGVTGATGREWIAHEIKVSRSDYRNELLQPCKRDTYKAYSHRLYFVVPDGLLKPEEIEYEQPEYDREAMCPAKCQRWRRGKRTKQRVPVPVVHSDELHYIDHGKGWTRITCPECDGLGNPAFARVVREAPTLWVPPDMGLIIVNGRGQREIKKAPKHKFGEALNVYGVARRDVADGLTLQAVADLARWVSARPDPRHDGLVDGARKRQKEIRESERAWRERQVA